LLPDRKRHAGAGTVRKYQARTRGSRREPQAGDGVAGVEKNCDLLTIGHWPLAH
jgi:hypothetical protein